MTSIVFLATVQLITDVLSGQVMLHRFVLSKEAKDAPLIIDPEGDA